MKQIITLFSVACVCTLVFSFAHVAAQSTSVVSASPAISCSAPSTTLRFGDGRFNKKTEEVKKLQNLLQSSGYLTGEPTGFFGSATLRAVKKYQQAQGLSSTGFVGPQTLKALKSSCEPIAMCSYAVPPEGCTYVAGPNYDSTSQCGMVLSCGNGGNSTEAPASCKVWYDGCNTCSRSTPGGPLACTMMACIQGGDEAWFAAHKPTCREYFSTTAKTCTSGGKTYQEGESTSCIDIGGQTACIADATHVCRNGQWKIEGSYPIACTMEARLCSDGSMMPREANCTWRPDRCSSLTQ